MADIFANYILRRKIRFQNKGKCKPNFVYSDNNEDLLPQIKKNLTRAAQHIHA